MLELLVLHRLTGTERRGLRLLCELLRLLCRLLYRLLHRLLSCSAATEHVSRGLHGRLLHRLLCRLRLLDRSGLL